MTGQPKPPPHLSAASKKWWNAVLAEYALQPHHLRLLQAAAESWDRLQEARERLATDGLYSADRFGQLRPHPAVAVERDSRIAFAKLLRSLALEDNEPATQRGA